MTLHSTLLSSTANSLLRLSECQGGILDRLDTYDTQSNDVWSLGVILVNLTCGRNPWRQAHLGDETFHAFLAQPEFLRTILPISQQLSYILGRIFTVDPRHRCTLEQLRQLINEVDSFTMKPKELEDAHAAAQRAAAAVASASAPSASTSTTPSEALRQAYVSESVDAYYPSALDQTFSGESGYDTIDDLSGYESEYEVEIESVDGRGGGGGDGRGGGGTRGRSPALSSSCTTPGLDLDRSDSSGDGSSTILNTPQTAPSDTQAIPIPDSSCFSLQSHQGKIDSLHVGTLRIANPSSPDPGTTGHDGAFRL